MKNFLVYLNPLKQFDKENDELTKIQIDNSLDLGWKIEDILLVTNFDYEYRGVKALVVGDDCYYSKNNFYRSSKVPVINRLFENGVIEKGEVYWFRDNDAFQLEPINESDLELGDAVLGITDHSWHTRWNAGSFFFTDGARDIFYRLRKCMDEENMDEQCGLEFMLKNNDIENYKLLNITYNFGIYYHIHTFKKAEKPLKVAHFHPHKERHLKLYTPLIPDRFINILKNYGLKAETVDLNQKIKDFQDIYYHYSRRTWVWEHFMKKYDCKNICEIGVRNGQNFELMTKHNPELAVAVDAWTDDGVLARNDRCYPQEELDDQYNKFKESVKDKPFVKIIRDYSFEAVKQFPDEHFDFIYIDADHTEEGCYQDMINWYPKVKKQGILCGHDYEIRGNVITKRGIVKYRVIEAVNRFAKEKDLEFFILKPTVWGMIKK